MENTTKGLMDFVTGIMDNTSSMLTEGLVTGIMDNTSSMLTEGLGNLTTTSFNEMSTETIITTTTTTTTTLATTTEEPCYPWAWPICDPWVQAANYFTYYGTYFAYAIGIPGSFFTILILCRMKPFNSASVWLLFISCIDLYSLTMRFIINQIQVYELQPWYDWSCRFFWITAETCEYVTYLNLVGLTVERFIAVWFPLKMAIWCTVRRAAAGASFNLAVVLCMSLYVIKTYRVNGYQSCIMRLKYRAFWQDVYQYEIETILLMVLPLIIITMLNILIACRLTRGKRVQQQMSDQKIKEREKQQKQVNRMLMAASIWFFFCVIMEIVYRLAYYDFGPIYPFTVVAIRVRTVLMNSSAVLRVYNHAANFILYIIAASKFRNELIRLATCNKFVGFRKRANNSAVSKYKTDTKLTTDGQAPQKSG